MELNVTTTCVETAAASNYTAIPKEAATLAAVCAILFAILGFTGNLITTISLLQYSKLRGHATTMFVLSLCVSDLLFCTINLPLTAVRYIHESWTLGPELCKMFAFFFYGNEAVSLLSMVAITVNRYIRISYYDRYAEIYTRTRIWIQLILIWAIAFGLMVPPALDIWGQLGLNEKSFSCTILPKDGRSPKKFLFAVGFALPCIVILISYTRIYYIVRASKRKLEGHSSKQTGQSTKERELTALMLTIFLCFLACFLPLMIMNIADDGMQYPWLNILASILAWASSVINPAIYAVTNRDYRAAYRNLTDSCRGNAVIRKTTWGSKSGQNSNSGPYQTQGLEKPTRL